MNSNPFLSKRIKHDARDLAAKRSRSAIDLERSEESNEFSQDAQDAFSKNERGSEDLMDMYEKGAFDN